MSNVYRLRTAKARRVHNRGDHALHDLQQREHQFHTVGNETFCDCKTDKQLECVFRLFHLGKAPAGFHDTDHKKENEECKPDSLQRSVDVYDHIPDRTASEILRRFGDELPYLAEFSIPCFQCIFKILHYPII